MMTMSQGIFNVKKHPLWGLAPLLTLGWHGVYTVYYLRADYLLFVCYTANLLLGVGVLVRSGLLIGAGFGWIVIGFPLWLYEAILLSHWDPSAVSFHVCGLLVGGMAIRRYRLPRFTPVFAIVIAVVLQSLARAFTDESLNVNAAFRVYEGWEGLFSNYAVYTFVMITGFSAFFILLTGIVNRRPVDYS
ncbi:MAG: hypothetical protein GY859_14355 [Desulfobacterales bacterium]|nr:hypothetical protein [Desulfobacterales bacterium]